MSNYVRQITPQQAVFFRQGKKKPLLNRLDIELTERCNLNCIHCYINQPANDQVLIAREMTTQQVKNILTEAAELGFIAVRFTGGEPLLRWDFSELYLYARRLGLRVILFSNITLLTPELADLLSRIPPLEKIEITVYGMSRESYATVTGSQTAYRKAMRGINLLLDRKIPFIVKGTIFTGSGKERQSFEKWAANLPWMDKLPTYAAFFDLRVRRDQPEKQQQIKNLRISPQAGLKLLNRDKKKYQAEMSKFCSKFMGVPGKKLFRCGAGHGGCVDAYGWIQPCMLLRHPDTVWNLKNHSLHKVLSEFFPKLRQKCAVNPDYLTRCARCRLKGLCEQCPGKSWMEHGTLDTPVEYLCRIAHRQAYELCLLSGNEKGWEPLCADKKSINNG